MRDGIHPEYTDAKFNCACGAEFVTMSTKAGNTFTEICSSCHPFYTGKQKLVDTAGRIDRFRKRYSK